MIERLTRNPLLLALAFVAAALAGAAVYAATRPAAGGADRGAIEAVVRDYVLANPEIIPEAMERLRAKETGKVVAENRQAIVEPFGSAWKGAADPQVTVVAYMDYACGFCRQSLPMLDQLMATDPGVRVVFRELPILSAESRTAAEWSLAAARQGKFAAFHDALYASGRLTPQAIEAAIARAGIDRSAGAAFTRSQAATEELSRNLSIAGKLGMTGTPAWVVGDRVLSGAVPLAAMQASVRAAREAS
ncbi:DsbA family protein [Sphingomonas baiyangensis]|uniref:DsbA family protein n=1 Tax=Sphingomonas baiyangensis TaxID=2572576 RepID=A0A4U1L2B2_9SPHN|nr:DsbA family protein [Sphingomonas baiyangensis]TKD51011.1 DsbA family protein [Sphingomonas baiyangensis]